MPFENTSATTVSNETQVTWIVVDDGAQMLTFAYGIGYEDNAVRDMCICEYSDGVHVYLVTAPVANKDAVEDLFENDDYVTRYRVVVANVALLLDMTR